MNEESGLNTCGCGQTYNPETSAGKCSVPGCGLKRSISRAPGESQVKWNSRLGLRTGKHAQHHATREIPG